LIEAAWPNIVRLIEKGCAVSDGELEAERIRDAAMRGSLWIWLAHDGRTPIIVAVIRMERWRQKTVARIVLLAGENLRTSLPKFQALKRALKKKGAQKIVFEGRKGWLRVLPEFRPVRVVAEMEI